MGASFVRNLRSCDRLSCRATRVQREALRYPPPITNPPAPPPYARSYKRLEESLNRLASVSQSYLAALRRATEEGRDAAASLEALAAADVRAGVVASSPDTARRIGAIGAAARAHGALRVAVTAPVEAFLTESVVARTSAALRGLPGMKRLVETRRQAATDFDAYSRKLDAARAKLGTGAAAGAGSMASADARDAVGRAEFKVRSAAASLAAATAAVSAALDAAEESRAALAADACVAFIAASVHTARHTADALAPLLLSTPEASAAVSELGGAARIAAAAARPRGYDPPPPPPPVDFATFRAALALPQGASLWARQSVNSFAATSKLQSCPSARRLNSRGISRHTYRESCWPGHHL